MPESVLLSNTTAKQRTFVVRLDDSVSDALSLDVLVSMSDDSATRRALSTEEEEEVETLFQKLKIASRKGNLDKLAKYRDRLTQLGVAIPSTAVGSAEEPAADTKDSAHDDDLQRYTLLTCDGRAHSRPRSARRAHKNSWCVCGHANAQISHLMTCRFPCKCTNRKTVMKNGMSWYMPV